MLVLCSSLLFAAGLFGGTSGHPDGRVKEAFTREELVPDIIDVAPKQILKVTFSDGTEVDLGNEITPRQTTDTPKIEYDADENSFYTLLMIDPDAPSREDTSLRSWEHWQVVNIPGSNLEQGEVKTEYVGSGAGQGTGFHRYTLLLFKQESLQDFSDESHLTNHSGAGRPSFNVRLFIKNHHLGSPVAGNFFLAKWDESVPGLMHQLGAR